ncbi:protein SMAX1-like [Phragmites australis]|uniref:protein SMAX1-like n=1 Tax=Phragmites australis TaxID=29695 RepID=UPI002D799A5C|nr:protein SMAX1-like [Phragmites australis]
MRAYAAPPAVATLPPAAPPLTPDAAAVLSRAAADASRRRHAHTTPLHAAAALLSGPAPLLRDACVAGLSSPHPLRCRALDLCFAVALDRLPTSTEHQHHAAPPLSNALAAALKRAYAHHRRIGNGGVEADDHRVGVPHLVLAILDDPSVARVMREASFSSTAVKAAMLRFLSDPAAPESGVYVNTRVLHRQASHREEEIAKVVEVLKRGKKRNPVLVGDTVDVDAVVQEVVTLVQRQRLGNARLISFPKEFGDLVDMDRAELVTKIKELGEVVRSELMAPALNTAGVVVNLGNLRWLVEERCAAHQGEQEKRRDVVLDTARAAVAEMARILPQSGEGEHRVWVIGTATCATYLKCQVYHPALEREWDLQAVPITPRPPPPPPIGLSPSVGVNRGILSSSVEVLSTAMTTSMQRAPSLCNPCMEGYERAEMASSELPPNPAEQPMSQWLQIGTPSSARPAERAQEKARDEADELRRRWRDRCAQLHSHGRPPIVTCSEWNGASVLANIQALPVRPSVQPNGTVDTDLVLGPAPMRPAWDTDEKLLVRRLTEAVRWQPEAAAAVASTITKAKSGEGKRRGTGSKADAWILFAGPDVVGKRNMAETLSKFVFGTGAVTVRLGCLAAVDDGGESIVSCRGRTALDRVAEAIRANPFRVIVLDGVDQADNVVHGSIVRAMESGRLADSHGRDVALGSNIFVVMSQLSPWPDLLRSSQESVPFADVPWNLKHGTAKRRPEQLDGDRRTKARKDSARELLPLDLNLSMSDGHIDDEDESGGEGSRNSSSDLTVEHEQDYGQPAAARFSAPSNVSELVQAVDGTVVFKPVHLEPLKRSVSDVASAKFGDMTGGGWSVRVDEVLCPSLRQLKRSFSPNAVVDGATVEGSGRRKDGEMSPMSVTVTVDGN